MEEADPDMMRVDENTKTKTGTNSNIVTSMHMFISFIGAGILGLPYAFMKSGLLGACIVLPITGTAATYAMMLLVACKKELERKGKRVTNFGDIGFNVMGKRGAVLIDFLVVFTQVSFCCAYLLFIGNNLNTVFSFISKSEIIVLCAPGLLLMTLIRRVENLTVFSMVADVCTVTGIFSVLGADVVHLPTFTPHVLTFNTSLSNGINETLKYDPKSSVIYGLVWSNLIYFFGVAIYCFEGVGVILHIEESMTRKEDFNKVLLRTMTVVTCMYTLFGVLGYITFQEGTKEIITLNLGAGAVTILVKFSLSLGLYFTYPLMMFPVHKVFENLPLIENRHVAVKLAARFGVVLFSVLVALVIPHFGDFVALVGAFACSSLALILPASLHAMLFGHRLSFVQKSVDFAIIGVGLFLAVTGTINATYEMLQN